MKKLLLGLIALVLLMPSLVFAKEPINVYVFEAGGCQWCKAEVEYLEGLSGYKTKFKIVRKELYVDHVDWEKGKDYKLGKEVAEAFFDKGYSMSGYDGTPLVVIGNLYSAATYSTELQSYIDKAYDNQVTDIVACFEKGKKDCADQIAEPGPEMTNPNPDPTDPEQPEKEDIGNDGIIAVLAAVVLLGGFGALYYFGTKKK